MRRALTIAGSDPSGGAGVQADLRVFQAFGVYGLSVISSLTAQSSEGVSSILPVPASFVRKQLSVLLTDIKPDSLKTGMLYSAENVTALAGAIRKFDLKNIVVDPVLVSSSGKKLAEANLVSALKKKLLPLCTVITPNIHEASVLTGMTIKTADDMKKAAILIHAAGAANVIITGGHLEDKALDVLYDGSFHLMTARKLPGEYHGTGCRFSAVIAALLAGGSGVADAARAAKLYTKKSFAKSFSTGRGMNLFRL